MPPASSVTAARSPVDYSTSVPLELWASIYSYLGKDDRYTLASANRRFFRFFGMTLLRFGSVDSRGMNSLIDQRWIGRGQSLQQCRPDPTNRVAAPPCLPSDAIFDCAHLSDTVEILSLPSAAAAVAMARKLAEASTALRPAPLLARQPLLPNLRALVLTPQFMADLFDHYCRHPPSPSAPVKAPPFLRDLIRGSNITRICVTLVEPCYRKSKRPRRVFQAAHGHCQAAVCDLLQYAVASRLMTPRRGRLEPLQNAVTFCAHNIQSAAGLHAVPGVHSTFAFADCPTRQPHKRLRTTQLSQILASACLDESDADTRVTIVGLRPHEVDDYHGPRRGWVGDLPPWRAQPRGRKRASDAVESKIHVATAGEARAMDPCDACGKAIWQPTPSQLYG